MWNGAGPKKCIVVLTTVNVSHTFFIADCGVVSSRPSGSQIASCGRLRAQATVHDVRFAESITSASALEREAEIREHSDCSFFSASEGWLAKPKLVPGFFQTSEGWCGSGESAASLSPCVCPYRPVQILPIFHDVRRFCVLLRPGMCCPVR